MCIRSVYQCKRKYNVRDKEHMQANSINQLIYYNNLFLVSKNTSE